MMAFDPNQADALAREFGPKILMTARRLRAEGSPLDVDELVSAGNLGLVQALNRFDPGRGLRFSTLAWIRIRGAMRDEVRRLTHSRAKRYWQRMGRA